MINNIVLGIVRFFIERQLVKWGSSIDWTKVKADVHERILKLLPNSMYDQTAAYIAGILVDIVADYFKANPAPAATAPEFSKCINDVFNMAQEKVVSVLAAKAMTAKV